MRLNLVFIICFVFSAVDGQNLVFKASFDDGTVDDEIAMNDGTSVGSIPDCGLDGDLGRVFRGSDFINYPGEVVGLLESAFTLSFYVQIENDEDEEAGVNLISIRNECGQRDTAFFLNYYPVANKIIADYWEDEDLVRVETLLDPNDCWHHIVLVHRISELALYVNGVQKNLLTGLVKPFTLDINSMFGVSASPCIGASMGPEVGLEGTIDELCIFDGAMDDRQVLGLYVRPDEILTRDTSIFEGGSVAIQTLESCAGDFNWFPTDGLSNTSDLEPIITPDVTTTYTLELDYGFCVTSDSITITISTAECDEVSLPTAFTPNNDQLNDELGISNPILIEDLRSFEIYDKWGAKMFETTDKNTKWDGNFRGVIPNTNTFLYRINYNCKGQEYFKSGSFTILR